MTRKLTDEEKRGFNTLRFVCPACGDLCVFSYRGTGRDYTPDEIPDSDLSQLVESRRACECENCGARHRPYDHGRLGWGVNTTTFRPFKELPSPGSELG